MNLYIVTLKDGEEKPISADEFQPGHIYYPKGQLLGNDGVLRFYGRGKGLIAAFAAGEWIGVRQKV